MLRQALADIHKLKCAVTQAAVCIKDSAAQLADFAKFRERPMSDMAANLNQTPFSLKYHMPCHAFRVANNAV